MKGGDAAPAGKAVVLVGPTASGKSDMGCALARRFGGWILSVDSMAVYRGLDIGTSKPAPEVRSAIPHRGLDLADPAEGFSLGDFIRAADAALAEMRSRRALPILVAGTGLYLRGVLKGVAALPRRDVAFRRRMLERERIEGPGTLHRLLEEADPPSARRISPADLQRLVRALELGEGGFRDSLAKPGAEWRGSDRFPSVKVGIRRSREELERRIRERLDQFLARGLLEETRQLLRRVPASSNAFKALGYRELVDHLQGRCDLETARRETVRNTLRYAKRQMTWFRKEPGVRWFDLTGPAESAVSAIGDHVEEELGRSLDGAE
ncbi:MAG TPA: tRNA (adenosine(37)-N6)-dimethylallyltransferase MiaA [Candidatus Polarisedimenticolia bacterium]|nr:tRNA (adenosine(37)-N6)-dimethylallyltransferase MiaA [Candidatus Polarisedimenticolia bacterium]